MFETFINWLKRVVDNLIPKSDVKKAMNIDVSISDTMVKKIEEWQAMYKGNAEWVNNDSIISLRIEKGIVQEFANVTLNEMETSVTNDKLNEIYQSAINKLNENLQSGLALGSMIIKPLGDNRVEYVTADRFIPIEFDSTGKLVKVVFVDVKQVGKNYYKRLEYHSLSKNGLSITNKVFVNQNENELGKETTLDSVEEWSTLFESVTFPTMTKVDFGYYRNPIVNLIDNSKNGVSIFESASELIKQADTQFGRLMWEYESGERAINVDITALKGGKDIEKLNKRLYKGLDQENLFNVFSPEFRDNSLISGLEEIKRNIELNVGLSYGDISKPITQEKTATEVKQSRKRKYNTVTAIQNNLRECLEDLVYALAFHNALTTSNYQFVCSFKDSILTDEETERSQDRLDVSMGVMSLAEYRAKWYNEPIELAEKNLPQIADIE